MSETDKNLPANTEQPRRRELVVIEDVIPILDTLKFEHQMRIAKVMGSASITPKHLMGSSLDQSIANCFQVVNQAVYWHMDPFAVARSMFILKGKLGFEGKLIAAALEARLGIVLDYEWNEAQPGSDAYGIVVSGPRPKDGKIVSIDGTVGDWKTFTKDEDDEDAPQQKSGGTKPKVVKANWRGLASRNQLAYRGTQEWMRLYTPGLVLGAFTIDELESMEEEMRSRNARDISPEPPPGHGGAIEEGEAKRGRGRPKRQAAAEENRFQADNSVSTSTGSGDDDARKAQVSEATAAGATIDNATGEVVEDATGAKAGAEEKKAEAPATETKAKAADDEPAAPPASVKKAESKPEPAKTTAAPSILDAHKARIEKLLEDIGPDKEVKDYIRKLDAEFTPFTSLDELRHHWETKVTKPASFTKSQQAHVHEFRKLHKTRIDEINDQLAASAAANENPAPPPGAKKDEPTFDYEAFLNHVQVELGKAKSQDEVAKFFDELTIEPLKEGLITEQQMDDDIRPLSIEAMERFAQ